MISEPFEHLGHLNNCGRLYNREADTIPALSPVVGKGQGVHKKMAKYEVPPQYFPISFSKIGFKFHPKSPPTKVKS